jgi:ATP-dependent exoDNAse (exonuclease V) alpha subunit
MGIFYLNVRTVSRSAGRRAIAAAAYCSRAKLWDGGLGREVDFSAASGLEHSEILLSSGAPTRWMDRAALWNEVEAIERRGDAQLAREIEIAIPGDLRADEGIALARAYMWEEFAERGMVVDLNIHRACAADGVVTLYVHALFSMREIVGDGFGRKRSDWKAEKLLLKWRERWVELLNGRVLAAGRRALARRGADAARGRGLDVLFEANGADRSVENFEIGWRNGERLLAEPGLALDALTERAASWTRAEMAGLVRRNTAGEEQYAKALARIESSVDLVRLPGGDRFSVRRLALDIRRDATAGRDAEAEDGRGTAGDSESRRTLSEALALWEAAGLRVRGVGLTYEAAKVFEKRTGIKSVGVHGLLGRWQKQQDGLLSNDVLVVNDAALLSLRQKEWMLKAARAAAARLAFVDGVRLVEIDGGAMGLDAEQLAVFGG